jgi:hypothetical protein
LKNRNEISMKSPLRCLSQKCFYYRFGALGLSLGYLIKVVATSHMVTTAMARGDLTEKIEISVEGEISTLKGGAFPRLSEH